MEHINRFLTSSKLSSDGNTAGVRITFEPRTDLTSYFIMPTDDIKKITNETVKSLVLELANLFGTNPVEIDKMHHRFKINPKSNTRKFVKSMIKYLKEETGYISEYFTRAQTNEPHLTSQEFESALEQELIPIVKAIANQMNTLI